MLKPAEFSSLFHIFIKIQEMLILLIIILRFCESRNLLVNICFEVSLTQLCMSIRDTRTVIMTNLRRPTHILTLCDSLPSVEGL